MKSKLNKLLDKVDGPLATADTVNYEGAKSFTPSLKEQFTQIMNCGGLFNTFYRNEEQILEQSLSTIRKYVKEDPQEASRIAIDARENGFMRDMPTFALSYLSKYPKIFNESFRIIRTPRDLIKFIDITRNRGNGHRGLGRNVKKHMNEFILRKLSPYYVMKYKKQIKDIVRLSHTKAIDVYKSILLDYVFDKEGMTEAIRTAENEKFADLQAFEMFKRNEIDHIKAISEYNLEMQSCIGVRKPTPEVWKALMPRMTVFQLIKNLRALEQHVDAKDILEVVKSKITVENLQRGMVLPFRVFQAYDKVANPFIKNYLGDVANEYPKRYDWSKLGKVCIAPDVSGSMTSDIYQISTSGLYGKALERAPRTKPSKVAGMLSGILKIGIGSNGFLLPWDNKIHTNYMRHGGSVVDIARDIDNASGGGTQMHLPVDYLLENMIKVDTFIGITDNEEWSRPSRSYYGRSQTHSWINSWIKYKKKVSPNARAYLMRVDPYPHQPFSSEQATKYDIMQVFGWSDKVFKIILNT